MSRGRLSLLVFATAGSLALIAGWTAPTTPLLGQGPVGAPHEGIAWRSDLNTARQEAAQSGRNLLLHFWAPWCGPCRRLETTVFNQATVAATLQQDFVPVKLNADDHRQIAEAFGVDRLPTDVIVRPDGAVLAKMTSPQNPSAYVAQVTAFSAPGRASGPSTEQLAAGHRGHPGGPGVQPAYANLHGAAAETVPFHARAEGSTAQGVAVQGGYGYGPPAMAAQQPILSASPYGDALSPQNSLAAVPPNANGAAPYSPDAGVPSRGGYGNYTPSAPAGGFGQPPLGGTSTQLAVTPPSAGGVSPRYTQPMISQAPPPVASHVNPSVAHHAPAGGMAPPVDHMAPGRESEQPQVGLEGFCPVTLKREQRWVAGDKRYGIVHRGCLYLFASPEQQQQFWADPDHYSPVLSGIDPVLALDNGATVLGRREHGVEYNGWIYLFSSESTLQHFSRNPERYAGGVRQAMRTGGGTTFR